MSPKLYVSVLFFTLFTSQLAMTSMSLQIDITPSFITEKTQGPANISCRLDSTDTDTKAIYLMEIIKNEGEPVVLVEATGVSFGPGISDAARFQADGGIDQCVGKSFLQLTIMEPTKGDAGLYTCKMFYRGQYGHLKEHRACGNLTVDKININDVVRQLIEKVTSLEESLKAQNDTVTELRQANWNLTQELATKADAMLTDRVGTLESKVLDQSQEIANLTEKVTYTTGFSASVVSNVDVQAGGVVVFGNVLVNEGKAYDGSTGVYTAPRDGLYAFSLSLLPYCGNCLIFVAIKADDTNVGTLWAHDSDTQESVAHSVVLQLRKGTRIKVVPLRIAKLVGGTHCSFSGHLIRAD